MEISSLEWGKIVVNNKTFKDIKIWNTTVKEWNWQETGTRHVPGIQEADFIEFIDQVDYLILSEGMENQLQVSGSALDNIGPTVKVIVGNTKDAVNKYNEIVRKGYRVGGLFHSPC